MTSKEALEAFKKRVLERLGAFHTDGDELKIRVAHNEDGTGGYHATRTYFDVLDEAKTFGDVIDILRETSHDIGQIVYEMLTAILPDITGNEIGEVPIREYDT